MAIFSQLIKFVSFVTKKYNIDESHGLYHGMIVLNNAYDCYKHEVINNEYLKKQEHIILVSALLHDMCDKKYMCPHEGLIQINNLLDDLLTIEDKHIILLIISTMSYSTVKKNGFPELNEYQLAYHIVREADLLASYDFDRCMIYNINRMNGNIIDAFYNAEDFFKKRVFKHKEDNLYITEYSIIQDNMLKINAMNRINNWRNIIKI